MTLKVRFTDEGLFVNKYKCNSVTIYHTTDGYTATMFGIDGITKRVPKLDRNNKQKLDYMGNKLFKILNNRKIIKSKHLEYSGINLRVINDTRKDGINNKFSHTTNKDGNYVNMYSVLPIKRPL